MKHDPYFNPAASACEGKEGFPSWRAANRIVKRKRRSAKAKGNDIPQMEPYRCTYCAMWHVGGRAK